jgi:hypothetical protein
MVVLSRDERRRRVIEFHNQNMGTREIAKLLHISFTDITKILKEADKEKEVEQQRTRQEFLASQAYKKFSEGKDLVEVAIELNIRAREAIILQREYLELAGLHDLNQIYEETKANPWPLINLYRSIRAEGMDVSHILILLKVANNDLLGIEQRCNYLKQEVKSLQEQKTTLYNQVTEEVSNLEYYRVQCQKEIEKFNVLQERSKKAEALVTHFENNNSEFINIRRIVEEKVHATLSYSKQFIYLALYCLVESIKKNPYIYSPLVSENMPPSESSYFDAKAMLAEQAAKMYEVLSKDLAREILNDYTVNKSSQRSLPMLPSYDSS